MSLPKRISLLFFAFFISLGCLTLLGCLSEDMSSSQNSSSPTPEQTKPHALTDFSLLIYAEATPCKDKTLANYRQTEAKLSSGTYRWSKDEEGKWKELTSNWVMPLTIDTASEVSEVYYISNQENVSFALYEYQDQAQEVSLRDIYTEHKAEVNSEEAKITARKLMIQNVTDAKYITQRLSVPVDKATSYAQIETIITLETQDLQGLHATATPGEIQEYLLNSLQEDFLSVEVHFKNDNVVTKHYTIAPYAVNKDDIEIFVIKESSELL